MCIGGDCDECLCLLGIGGGLTFTGGVLAADTAALAATVTPAVAAAITPGLHHELQSGFGAETTTAAVSFVGAAMPASGATIWTATLPITNPSATRTADVNLVVRRPSVLMEAANAANRWRVALSASSLGLANDPVAELDARGTTGPNLPKAGIDGMTSVVDRVTLGPGASTSLTATLTFTRLVFTANAANQLLLGPGGLVAQGVFL